MEYLDAYKIKAIGQRIQKSRKNKSLTQTKLAEVLGISIDQMSNIENGRSVCKPDYIYQLVQILGISSDYLIFGEKIKLTDSLDEKIISSVLKLDKNSKNKLYKIICIINKDYQITLN